MQPARAPSERRSTEVRVRGLVAVWPLLKAERVKVGVPQYEPQPYRLPGEAGDVAAALPQHASLDLIREILHESDDGSSKTA